MSSQVSLMHWSEKLQRGESRELDLFFNISAAKTAAEVQAMPVLHTFDAFASQAVIDAFLGTSSEFLLAAFDATSMGADAFGGVINMQGQAKEVIAMSAKCYSGTGGATLVERVVQDSAALTASTLATELALGSSGNIGFKVDFGNTPDFDALTAGLIHVKIIWKSK